MVQTVQENIELSAVPSSKRGVGHKTAVRATPTANCKDFCPDFSFVHFHQSSSVQPSRESSMIPILFSHQGGRDRLISILFSHQGGRDRLISILFSHQGGRDRLISILFSHQGGRDRLIPILFSHQGGLQ